MAKRKAMQDVCLNCHQQAFVDGHYFQYDAMVKLYNEKTDKLFADDPMHKWFNTNTADIKSAIKSGEFQKIYSELFKQDVK